MRIRRVLVAGMAAAALVLTGCGTTVPGSAAPAGGAASDAPSAGQITTPADPTSPEPGAEDPGTEEPGGEEPAEPTEEPAEPAEPTAEPAEPTESGDISIEEFGAFLEEANLAVDSARGSMIQESTAGDLEATYEMSAINSGNPSMLMSMKQEVSGQTIDLSILLVDGVAYLGGDEMLSALGVTGASGKWLLLDSNSSNPLLAQMADEMASVTESAGVGQAEQIVSVAKSVREVGPTQAEGYDVIEYELLVDGAAMASQLGAPAGSSMADVPVQLWVTPEGALVKMVMAMEIGGERASTTMTMYDHNEPVDITAPGPDELVELPN